ncbi:MULTISPECIES: PIG-L deacetylase family protein [Bradyrhizobium]|jgi:LmbE family N-acetylglucosaminyl deacetylase|uniref:PIG-L family deacetylase n=1 Tax=Bradyrhizobium denitrificans TaxID=2734912 RepID=A0ABS5GAU7_9BRAD|nr:MULTISPECIES: PIG-L deacetylase family protein [Bradyrhizobium]MBR1138450.1 PIG-L family deacetylase [Bradyrhizobium denitrificans]MDU1491032.1 PIG-L deacetylase family protein [Bradyrhizobium sp.]MDU1541210.1 PIG-L deacetylase family protein [Bradyrhizobium sp.]MDU1670127.1 PIG-L deacetylase family protein [Bradyrhizobium sp.]MDU1692789.1 PIG-L deacetylase family protein [Bradyrhizobium sp.]
MIGFKGFKDVRRLLCIGAHSDDIEIGAGGTVLRIMRENPDVAVTWCVLSGNEVRQQEARLAAESLLGQDKKLSLLLREFPDAYFPEQRRSIKEFFEQFLKPSDPDLILTHARHDAHQDHRLVNELTWNTFRSHQIWEYEIPKWDGDLGQPNLYVPVEPDDVTRKLNALRVFTSQRSKHWFDEETFRSLLRLRGLESNSRYAEAFTARKFVVG